jgi:hypothetical protein
MTHNNRNQQGEKGLSPCRSITVPLPSAALLYHESFPTSR